MACCPPWQQARQQQNGAKKLEEGREGPKSVQKGNWEEEEEFGGELVGAQLETNEFS